MSLAEAAAPQPSHVHTRRGAVVVELFVPIAYVGRIVSTITLGPVQYDHVRRWLKGDFETTFALLANLSGESEELLWRLCYPDVDRVFAAFINMMPAAIQIDVMKGVVPRRAEPPPEPEVLEQPPLEMSPEQRSFFEEQRGPLDAANNSTGFDVEGE